MPSKQCGSKGKQKRSIFCQSTQGKRVSKKRCRLEHGSKFKPKRKRRCEKTVCGFKSCEDVRQVGNIVTQHRAASDKVTVIYRVSGFMMMVNTTLSWGAGMCLFFVTI